MSTTNNDVNGAWNILRELESRTVLEVAKAYCKGIFDPDITFEKVMKNVQENVYYHDLVLYKKIILKSVEFDKTKGIDSRQIFEQMFNRFVPMKKSLEEFSPNEIYSGFILAGMEAIRLVRSELKMTSEFKQLSPLRVKHTITMKIKGENGEQDIEEKRDEIISFVKTRNGFLINAMNKRKIIELGDKYGVGFNVVLSGK